MSQEHSPTQQDSDKAVLFCKTFQHEKSSPEQAGKFLGCQDIGQSGQGPGEEQKTQRGHFPLGTEGPGFAGIISFSREVDTYWVGVSQVLGPDPEPLGRQRLRVTPSCPAFRQAATAHSPAGGNTHTSTDRSRLHSPLLCRSSVLAL